jgi:hypothetical protein
LRCGSVDLLRDDLVLAPGSAPPPIDVTLRNDVAQLTVGFKQKGRPAAILVYSSEYPRRSVVMSFAPGSPTVSFPSLPPGAYQVLALKNVADLEYRNPVVTEKYLAHAASLTLQPRDNIAVSVDILDSLEQPETSLIFLVAMLFAAPGRPAAQSVVSTFTRHRSFRHASFKLMAYSQVSSTASTLVAAHSTRCDNPVSCASAWERPAFLLATRLP